MSHQKLLRRLVGAEWLWQPPAAGERCVQFASYDRASQRGSGDRDAWYANGDRGQHLRVEQRGGVSEYVMVDAKGPGCIARIWSANPQGTLHFDIDGERAWSVDFAQLLTGGVPGVPEPLAGLRSKGGNCHLPIPFAKSLVVSCTAGDCYYAFDVVQWADSVRVPSFAPSMLEAMPDVAASLSKGFAATFPDGWRSADTSCVAGAKDSRLVIKPGRSIEELLLDARKVPAAARADLLRRMVLVVRAGGEETVRVPVTDFFGGGPSFLPWRSHLLGIGDDGTAISYWPMPFPDGGEAWLEVEGDLHDAEVQLSAVTEPFPLLQGRTLLFRASYHLAKGTPTRPFGDHLVLDAKGEGRFVGCSLLVRNPSRVWWGEGDEKFFVDGETFPSWFGTGTEDYFGYAWCDPTPFQSPFHAQIECQGPQNYGFTQLHRTHLLDSVPFQRSFRFELERWHWVEDIAMDYATVAYWYGAKGATSGLPPVPSAAERNLPKLGPPPVFVAERVIEGEDLRVLACPSGVQGKQETWFLATMFSRDAQLLWHDGKPGDSLVLALPVATAGRYRVSAAFCQAEEHGIVQVSLAGKALGSPVDGHAAKVRSSGLFELGIVDLPAGEAELRLLLTGRNELAKPRFLVGLDYVKLELLP